MGVARGRRRVWAITSGGSVQEECCGCAIIERLSAMCGSAYIGMFIYYVIKAYSANVIGAVVRHAVLIQYNDCRSRKSIRGCIPMYIFSAVYFLYFVQALIVSDITSRTPNKDKQVEQLVCSYKFYNPETSMSSAVSAFLHAIRTRVKIVPRVAQNLLPQPISMIQAPFCSAIIVLLKQSFSIKPFRRNAILNM